MRAFVMVAAVTCALMLSACGAAREKGAGTQASEGSTLEPGLASPSALLTLDHSTSSMELHRLGSEYDSRLPYSRITVSGNSLIFQPQASGKGIRGFSFAGYSFSTNGYSGNLEFNFVWDTVPPSGDAWLALVDFETLQYDWYAVPDDGHLQIGVFAPQYQNPQGLCIATVLLRGTAGGTLASLRLGVNQPPQAQLNASLNPVEPGCVVTLDGAASTDSDGTVVRWEFDPLGDGSFVDTLGPPQLEYVYPNEGSYTAALRVTDNEGASATASLEMTVQSGGGGLVPVLSVTPAKTNPGEPVLFDASMSLDYAGTIVKYEFDPEGDGSYIDNGGAPTLEHSYTNGGNFYASLRITDDQSNLATVSQQVMVGWTRTLRGGNSTAITPHGVATDSAGNLFVCGEGLSLASPSSGIDGYLAKYSPDGALLWEKVFAAVGAQVLFDLALDSQGNLFAAGYSRWSPEDFPDLELLRINPANGNAVWRRQWLGLYQPKAQLLIDSQNRLTLMGEEIQSLGETNVVIIGMDTDAVQSWELLWQSPANVFVYGSAVDGDGNIYGSGSIDGEFDQDGFIWSLASDGSKRWSNTFDSQGSDELHELCFAGGNLYATGSRQPGTAARGLLLKTGGDGSLAWCADYAHTADSSYDRFFSAAPRSDGVAVWGTSSAGVRISDALALLIDANGSLLRQQAFGSATQESTGDSAILAGADGALYCTGYAADPACSFTSLSGSFSLLSPQDYNYQTYGEDPAIWDLTSYAADSDILAWPGCVEDDGGALLLRRFEP